MLMLAARWLYRKLGHRYFLAYLGFEVTSALAISVATVGIFSLYQRISSEQMHVITLVSWGCVLVGLAAGVKKVARSSLPLRRWRASAGPPARLRPGGPLSACRSSSSRASGGSR